MKFWVGVASQEHVRAAVVGGFAQLGHGKQAPIRKLDPGDWITYYSPKTSMSNGEPVQAFTAIGKVRAGDPYQLEQTNTFCPFRRDVDYRRAAHSAAFTDLRECLSFTRGRGSHWGMAFRRGSFQIPYEDFVLIAEAMQIRPPADHPSNKPVVLEKSGESQARTYCVVATE